VGLYILPTGAGENFGEKSKFYRSQSGIHMLWPNASIIFFTLSRLIKVFESGFVKCI